MIAPSPTSPGPAPTVPQALSHPILDFFSPVAQPQVNTDRYTRIYVEGVLLALLLCWSPSNALAYLSPFLMLTWFFLRTRSRTILRNTLLVLAGWISLIFAHGVWWQDYAWVSASLTLLTYSSFLPILVIPSRFLNGHQMFARLRRPVVYVILIQTALGLTQALYGYRHTGGFDTANGDHVEGTIHPWLASEKSFSNPMFAVNMTFLLLFLMPPFLLQRRHIPVVLGGVLVLILASVVHVMLFIAAAMGLVFLFYLTTLLGKKSGCLLLTILLIGAILATTLLSRNFSQVTRYAERTLAGDTPRAELVYEILPAMLMEYPAMSLVGLGPGQFSSRAGLIGTGRYFGRPDAPRPLPLIPLQMSQPFETHFLPLWLYVASRSYYGSTHQPFSSWVSVFTELGIVAWLIIAVSLTLILWQIRRLSRTRKQPILAIVLSSGILIIFLLGFQENYWEVPQAIFPGLLLLKAMYAQLRTPLPSQ
jgi:hypothetical protein